MLSKSKYKANLLGSYIPKTLIWERSIEGIAQVSMSVALDKLYCTNPCWPKNMFKTIIQASDANSARLIVTLARRGQQIVWIFVWLEYISETETKVYGKSGADRQQLWVILGITFFASAWGILNNQPSFIVFALIFLILTSRNLWLTKQNFLKLFSEAIRLDNPN